MAAETQKYLTTAGAATARLDAAVTASKEYFAFVGNLAQKAQELRQLLAEAEIAEVSDDVRSQFEGCFQKFGAIQREADTIQRSMRSLLGAVREWRTCDVQVRAAAQRAGYTT